MNNADSGENPKTVLDMYNELLRRGAIAPTYGLDLLTMPSDRIPVVSYLSTGTVMPVDNKLGVARDGKLE